MKAINESFAPKVAPVMEHIIGPEWFTKYQPVSFRLDSRSGSASELRDMAIRGSRLSNYGDP